MTNIDEIRATGLFSEGELQAAQQGGGFVGTRTIEGVGEVEYHITKRGTAAIPSQQGDFE